MSLLILLLLVLIMQPMYGYTQDNISFEYLDAGAGLSNSWIDSITQDKYGFLWIGTQFGLNRYDGYSITPYLSQSDDENSISGDSITTTFLDSDGFLWIGTVAGGLNRYNYQTDDFTSYLNDPDNKKSLSDNYVTSISQDDQGRIWVGTSYGGLNLMHKDGSFTSFHNQPDDNTSLSNNSVTSIVPYSDEEFLVGTRHGLNLFNYQKGVFSVDNWQTEVFSQATITTIYRDSKGSFWIATENNGLYHLNPEGKISLVTMDGRSASVIQRTFINDILEDNDGNFWFCTASYGVVKYSPGKNIWQLIQNDPGSTARLPHNAARVVFQDSSGILWIGTEKGVVKHNKVRDRFRVYLNDRAGNSSLSGIKVFAITPLDEHSVWIGSGDGGVTLLNLVTDEREYIQLNEGQDSSLLRYTVRAVIYDDSGSLWIGTEGHGLFVYNPETGKNKHYQYNEKDPQGLPDNFIRFLFRDSKNRIWMGSEKGGLSLFHSESGKFQSYPFTGASDGPASDRIFCMLEEEDGKFWLGTDKGVNIFDYDRGEFSVPAKATGYEGQIKSGLVISGFRDISGDLWFGTTGGLYHYKKSANKFENISTREGMPDNLVYAISEDWDGNIWCSTNDGLAQINKETKTIKKISVFKVPLTNEYNVGAVCRMPSGELLFGAMHGLVRFLPGHLLENRYNPPVYLASYKKFEEKVDIGISIMDVTTIDIMPDDHFVTLEFVSLDFDNPQNNKYRYKLQGLEEEWINLGSRRYISFTSLPPNSYKLIVQGSNSSGVWSQKQVELQLVVHPHYWNTWWFRIIAGLLVLAVILTFYTMRTRAVRIQRDILRKEVALRTSQLMNQNDRLNEQKLLLEENSKVLEQTNKELESFTYTVAHDLRAPLRHIAGFNDLVFSEYGKDMDDTAKTYFARINGSINRMNELIDNFLRFATSTKQDVIRTEVNISRIARDSLLVIQESDPDRDVEIKIEENMIDQCDLKLIKVVMENLLSNAWKYSRKTEKALIEVGFEDKDGERIYFVKDNGIGFDNQRGAEIFKPFQRLHSEKEFSGIGIGLATVQRIIHRHSGRIWAEGYENQGSTFYFTLS